MCIKLGVLNIDEDVRLAIESKLNLVKDILGWVPTYIQSLVGALTGYKA